MSADETLLEQEVIIANRVRATVKLKTGNDQQYVDIKLHGLVDPALVTQIHKDINFSYAPPEIFDRIFLQVTPEQNVSFVYALRDQIKFIAQQEMAELRKPSAHKDGSVEFSAVAHQTKGWFGGIKDGQKKPTKAAQGLYEKILTALKTPGVTKQIEEALQQLPALSASAPNTDIKPADEGDITTSHYRDSLTKKPPAAGVEP